MAPDAVTTDRSTAPAAWAGATAVIWVAVSTDVGGCRGAPKVTAVAAVKSVPVMVTVVPPAAGPLLGLRPVMVGAGAPGGAHVRLQAHVVLASGRSGLTNLNRSN